MSFDKDSMFTPDDFVERYNSDLANDLGNLLNRTIGMMNKYFDGYIPNISKHTEFDASFEEYVNDKINNFAECMDTYHVSNALIELWNIISRTNKYIDETAPWVLSKEGNTDELKTVMYYLAESLRKIAILLKPFMKNTSESILSQLNINDIDNSWDTLLNYNDFKEGTKVIEKGEPLFVRLDKEEEIEYIKEQMKK